MSPNSAINLELASFCDNLGFSGALVSGKVYADDVSILSQLLNKTLLNFFLYNPPSSSLKEVHKLIPFIEKDRIIGVKDSSGDIPLVQEMIHHFRSDSFKIYYGREHQIDKALALDIDGIFPASANVQPGLLLNLWKNKDEVTFDLFKKLKEQIQEASPGNYIQGLKNLLINKKIISE